MGVEGWSAKLNHMGSDLTRLTLCSADVAKPAQPNGSELTDRSEHIIAEPLPQEAELCSASVQYPSQGKVIQNCFEYSNQREVTLW
jgi:hypothetical protein